MYKFIHEHKTFYDVQTRYTKEVYYETDLTHILQEFASFLRGVGFIIDGELEVVNYDDFKETSEEIDE